MPRVISFKLGFFWVAFRLNDYDEVGPRRFAFGRKAAIQAAAMAPYEIERDDL